MKITLISREIRDDLVALQQEHPELTFQNEGYERLPRAVQEAKKEQIERISEILREHVCGFQTFFNFRLDEEGQPELRFDYNWGAEDGSLYFVGVGYLRISELHEGFRPEAQAIQTIVTS